MLCPRCNQEIPDGHTVCPSCEAAANPYAATDMPQATPVYVQSEEGDKTGGVIPYKNPKALIAYYLGILGGLPLIGLPIGVVAFVLGVMGLRDRKQNPVIRGAFHAWVGIGCGGFFVVFWCLLIGLVVVAVVSAER